MDINANSILSVSPNAQIYPLDSGANETTYIVENENGKRFEVNAAFVEFLNLLDGSRTIKEVHESFASGKGSSTNVKQTIHFIQEKLIPLNILSSGNPIQNSKTEKSEKRPNYMWFKMSLLKPHWIESLTQILSALYHPVVAIAVLSTSVLTHILLFFRWMNPQMIDADYIFSAKFIIIYICINLGSMIHELGHAAALKRFGQKHGSIGFGFYLFMVVLYTNVSNAWRLKRWQRVVVNVGGMYFELIWMLIMLILFAITGDTIYLIIHFLMDVKLLFNLMPFFRMDGYWLVSDATGISNLREKSNQVLGAIFMRLKSVATFPDFWYRLKKWQRYFLMLYALSATVFFAWVGLRLIQTSFTFVKSMPLEWDKIYALGNASHFSLKQLYFQFGYLFGKLVLILFTLFFCINLLKKSGKFIRSLGSRHV